MTTYKNGSRSHLALRCLACLSVVTSVVNIGMSTDVEAAVAPKSPFGAPDVSQTPMRKISPKTASQPAKPIKSVAKAPTKTAAKPSPKSAPSRSVASVAKTVSPNAFIQARAQKVLTALLSRPVRLPGAEFGETEIDAGATKTSWLTALYTKNLVDASWATRMLSDKRILSEVIKSQLGGRAESFYPKTLGLKEFLISHNFVDSSGRINANGEQIEAALYEDFPSGFVVRPAVGVAPQETGKGIYADTDSFLVDLFRDKSPLYDPSHYKTGVRSHILGEVASGEAVVLQDNIVASADARKPLKSKYFQEVRVHTYEAKVIDGAIPVRWVQKDTLDKNQRADAEKFAGEFLAAMPLPLLTRQAWGVDVAVLDNGEMRIIDVVTNRGVRGGAWSGYLDQPRVIGAYTRHFENYYGMRFKGLSGSLIRHNLANYVPYWEKRIEKAKPGLMGKVTAYLPPVP